MTRVRRPMVRPAPRFHGCTDRCRPDRSAQTAASGSGECSGDLGGEPRGWGHGSHLFVRLLVGWLQEAGHQPAIAMRGYGSANPNEADEVREHRLACPDVPVLAGADRVLKFRKLQREGAL